MSDVGLSEPLAEAPPPQHEAMPEGQVDEPSKVDRMEMWLRISIIGLGVTILAEVIAGYTPSALTDAVTFLFGLSLIRKSRERALASVPAFTMVAGFNFIFQVIFMVEMLSRTLPHRFLATTCVTSVPSMHDGEVVHEDVDLCSWQTLLGDISVCLAVVFEFLCTRFSWKLFQALREDYAQGGAFPSAVGAWMEVDGLPNSLEQGAFSSSLHAPQRGSRGHDRRSTAQLGFQPFSGQPHKLCEEDE